MSMLTVECGCQCSHELASECSRRFNSLRCECECQAWEFGERKAYCKQCQSKIIAARGGDLGVPVSD